MTPHLQRVEALMALRPGSKWTMTDGKIVWQDDSQSLPSDKEIQDWVDANDYKKKRLIEYPSLADQLDAIWKGGADQDAMQKQIQAVKAKYPKP